MHLHQPLLKWVLINWPIVRKGSTKLNHLLAQVLTHVSLGNFREGRELAKDRWPELGSHWHEYYFYFKQMELSRFRKSSIIPQNCQLVLGR